jgi:hypothetical protein
MIDGYELVAAEQLKVMEADLARYRRLLEAAKAVVVNGQKEDPRLKWCRVDDVEFESLRAALDEK